MTDDLVIGHGVSAASYPQAARSYLADGRGVAWTAEAPPGWRSAVDAELLDQRVPAAIVRRAGLGGSVDAETFWRAWTQAEVRAKLDDVPILLWLTRHGLDAPTEDAAMLRTEVVDGVVVTCGLREIRP